MGSVLASSAVYRGFEPRSGQTKDYKIGICCFSTKHAALRSKSKEWLARDQNNVSEWSDMSVHGLLFRWATTIRVQLSVLVYNKANLIIISLNINLFSPCYSWKNAELALNNNHSLTHSLTHSDFELVCTNWIYLRSTSYFLLFRFGPAFWLAPQNPNVLVVLFRLPSVSTLTSWDYCR
jgi:hypothetical protein